MMQFRWRATNALHTAPPNSSELRADETGELACVVVEAGEDGLKVGNADVLGQDFADDGTEIRGEREVAAFVELMIIQAGPFAVDLSAFDVAAHDEHAIGVAMVGATIPVFLGGTPEFTHGHKDDVFHAVAQVLMKSGEALAEILQQI